MIFILSLMYVNSVKTNSL